MIKKDKHRFADGSYKTQVRVVEGYRDKSTGKVRQRTIKSFGYLEDNLNQDEFLNSVKDFDNDYINSKKINISFSTDIPFTSDENSLLYNFGFKFLSSIYDELKIDEFFNNYKYNGKHQLNHILKFMVIERLLNPESKRATFQNINHYYGENFSFSLDELYRSLDHFNIVCTSLQKYLNDKIKKSIGRNLEYAYYDVTNYHFEIDYNDEDYYEVLKENVSDKRILKKNKIINLNIDGEIKQAKTIEGLRKKGVSKQHQLTPIIQMGLFIDDNGLPINYSIFPGNTSDSLTLPIIFKEVKEAYHLNRLIVVADKGMNSNENIDMILNNGDGYVFSQILRGKKGNRFHSKLFQKENYTILNEDYKYQLFDEEYVHITVDGKKEPRKRKVLIYHSKKDEEREKRKRDEKISKAERSLGNNVYSASHSYDKYIKDINLIKATGEIADQKKYLIDYEKAENEAKYDGYFCIITSEENYTEEMIRKAYHGLWRIEESFKITKNEIELRPIYLQTKEHINGHFLICFISLLIIRMLQYKLDYKISVERIVRGLNMCACHPIAKNVMHLVKDINKKEMTDDEMNETVEDFKEILKCFNAIEPSSVITTKNLDRYLNSIKY
jgi:transposase